MLGMNIVLLFFAGLWPLFAWGRAEQCDTYYTVVYLLYYLCLLLREVFHTGRNCELSLYMGSTIVLYYTGGDIFFPHIFYFIHLFT